MINEHLVAEIEIDDKIMRQVILIIILIACVFSFRVNALTAEQAFISAPESVFPLLNKSTRLDMVDYFNSGSTTPSKNKLSGNSRVTSIKINDLQFEMSTSSAYQIAILDLKDGTEIIALIETIKAPAIDSNISFYTTEWDKIGDKYFAEPQLKDWLTLTGKKNIKEVESLVPFMLVGYVYDAMKGEMILNNDIKSMLSEDVYESVASYFKAQLKYCWTGKQFKLIK